MSSILRKLALILNNNRHTFESLHRLLCCTETCCCYSLKVWKGIKTLLPSLTLSGFYVVVCKDGGAGDAIFLPSFWWSLSVDLWLQFNAALQQQSVKYCEEIHKNWSTNVRINRLICIWGNLCCCRALLGDYSGRFFHCQSKGDTFFSAAASHGLLLKTRINKTFSSHLCWLWSNPIQPNCF